MPTSFLKKLLSLFSFALQLSYSMINGVFFIFSLLLFIQGFIPPRHLLASIISPLLLLAGMLVAYISGRIFYKNEPYINTGFIYTKRHNPMFLFLAAHGLLFFYSIPFVISHNLLTDDSNLAKMFPEFFEYLMAHYHFIIAATFVMAFITCIMWWSNEKLSNATPTKRNTAITVFIFLFYSSFLLITPIRNLIVGTQIQIMLEKGIRWFFGPSILLVNLHMIVPWRRLFEGGLQLNHGNRENHSPPN